MIKAASLNESLLELLSEPGPTGVLALADDLLLFCIDHQVSLMLSMKDCTIVDALHQRKETIPVTLSKSVLRTLLARFATLCTPAETMTPYGGTGRIELPDQSATVQVSIKNTADHQWLELHPAPIV